MYHKNLDLLMSISFVAVSIVWTLLSYHVLWIGIVLALPLAFGLPGYTLTQVLMYKQPLEPVHTVVFSLGLSLVIDVLGGFILNLLPGGLQATSWVLFLGVLTVVFSSVALYLRRGVQKADRQSRRLRLSLRACVLFGLAIAIAVLAIRYSVEGAAQQPRPGFTQLWLLPSNQSDNSCAVQLGIRSFEISSTKYFVMVILNGAQANSTLFISLAPGQEWQKSIPVALKVVRDVHIEARLYREDKPNTAYRTVSLTLFVQNVEQSGKERKLQCKAS